MLAKLFTTLTLVVAQTMTWAGGPLFLCVDSAGDVCIDGGPDACEGCPADKSHASSGCAEHATCKASAQCSNDAPSVTGEPCGCQHELISQQSTKATSNSTSMSIGKLLHTTAWATCQLSDAPLLLAHWTAAVTEWAPDAANPQLGRIGSIVLRC